MVQKQITVLVDDVDGGEASETVTFSLDGVTYEIDLSEENAAKLRDDFAPWVGQASRKSRREGTRKAPARRSGGGSRPDLNEVRAWGRANGFEVSDRGRVSAALQEAYDKAH